MLVQSEFCPQAFDRSHPRQTPPPQSTSVSRPFLTMSEHVGARQTMPVQTPLVQSVVTLHPRPSAQGRHVVPPQSTPVSSLFFTMSVQLDAWQLPLLQILLAQSVSTEHVLASAQGPHVGPPQSTSVSLPFLSLSVHDSRQTEPEHAPPMQSLFCMHPKPGAQGEHEPPQSTSVSVPFSMVSEHVGT